MELIKISTRRSVILICSPCLRAREKKLRFNLLYGSKVSYVLWKIIKKSFTKRCKIWEKICTKNKTYYNNHLYIFVVHNSKAVESIEIYSFELKISQINQINIYEL